MKITSKVVLRARTAPRSLTGTTSAILRQDIRILFSREGIITFHLRSSSCQLGKGGSNPTNSTACNDLREAVTGSNDDIAQYVEQ